MKKFFLNFILLLVFSGFVFVMGCVTFFVPHGSRAVIVTKTSGVYSTVVRSGKFLWMWERLLPTNMVIRNFDETPKTTLSKVKYELPSAALIKKFSLDDAKFTNEFSVETELKISDKKLISLVKELNFEGNDDAVKYLETVSDQIAKDVADYLIKERTKDEMFNAYSVDKNTLIEKLDLTSKFEGIDIISITVKNASFADMKFYNEAKQKFDEFTTNLETFLNKKIETLGDKIIGDTRDFKRLEMVGEILKKYPELSEPFKSGAFRDLVKVFEDNN